MKRQLDLSKEPIFNITGGRDSRCLAAVAKRVGYSGDLVTLGSKTSSDGKIGNIVSKKLQLNHSLRYPNKVKHQIPVRDNVVIVKRGDKPLANKLKRMTKNKERLLLWAKLHEGLETFRHAYGNRNYYHAKIVSPYYNQVFHGLGGEVHRGASYHLGKVTEGVNSINQSVSSWAIRPLILREEAINSLQQSLIEIDQAIDSINGTKENWLDLFYWQKRMLHWGQDMMSVKSMSGHHWTPLFDGELIKLTKGLTADYKSSEQFVEELTLLIAPELKGVPYDKNIFYKKITSNSFTNTIQKIGISSYKKIKDSKMINYFNKLKSTERKKNIAFTQFWSLLLLDNIDNCVWPSLIDESYVRTLIIHAPQTDTLWSILTVELVHQANQF